MQVIIYGCNELVQPGVQVDAIYVDICLTVNFLEGNKVKNSHEDAILAYPIVLNKAIFFVDLIFQYKAVIDPVLKISFTNPTKIKSSPGNNSSIIKPLLLAVGVME
ncbi:unnamed protein product [Ilex paraguariensis]|uniref:Uncharacterized protein n=1 Tax=Ilex paraguariensis TaxID=185542 RepID=A0ABC8U4H2_9AQUA